MDPPMMAPVLFTALEDEASGASVEASADGVSECNEVVDEETEEKEAENDDGEGEEEESADCDVDIVESILEDTTDSELTTSLELKGAPATVGVERKLGEAVSGTEMLGMDRAPERPAAATATVAPSVDAEPQPYWKWPPSKTFR